MPTACMLLQRSHSRCRGRRRVGPRILLGSRESRSSRGHSRRRERARASKSSRRSARRCTTSVDRRSGLRGSAASGHELCTEPFDGLGQPLDVGHSRLPTHPVTGPTDVGAAAWRVVPRGGHVPDGESLPARSRMISAMRCAVSSPGLPILTVMSRTTTNTAGVAL
jgi:hypothetical protein